MGAPSSVRLGLTGLCMLGLMQLTAQVSIGTRVGISFSRIEMRSRDAPELVDLIEEDMVPSIGVDVVVPIELPQSRYFAVQPEIGVVMKGMAFENDNGPRSELRLNFAEIALLAKGRLRFGSWRGDLFAGPGFLYGLSVRTVQESSSSWVGEDFLLDFDETPMEISGINIAFGAGLSYGRGVPTFFLNYRYAYGLSDAFRNGLMFMDNNGAQIAEMNGYHRSSVISFGILVPLSRAALRSVPASPAADPQ